MKIAIIVSIIVIVLILGFVLYRSFNPKVKTAARTIQTNFTLQKPALSIANIQESLSVA